MTTCNITTFLLFQVIAVLFFKWGSTAPGYYWREFGFGNTFGITSTLLMINIYKTLPPGITLSICTGGSFLLTQLAMRLFFQAPLSLAQYGGIGMIFIGVTVVALGQQSA